VISYWLEESGGIPFGMVRRKNIVVPFCMLVLNGSRHTPPRLLQWFPLMEAKNDVENQHGIWAGLFSASTGKVWRSSLGQTTVR